VPVTFFDTLLSDSLLDQDTPASAIADAGHFHDSAERFFTGEHFSD
jgi:hypothetical protein